MRPRIACEPPLGQVTVIAANAVFHVSLSSDDTSPSDKQNHLHSQRNDEVAIWHNGHGGGEWGELILQKIDPPYASCSRGSAQYFSGTLARPEDSLKAVSFTLRFRIDDGDWQWVNDIDNLGNGELFYQIDSVTTNDLSTYIEYLNPVWNYELVHSTKDSLVFWSLEHEIAAAHGNESGWSNANLGLPKDYVRWFALVRHSTPWLGPRQGEDAFNPDKDAILASFLRRDGLHLLVLAMNGLPDVTTTISHDGQGHVTVTSRNDSTEPARARVLVAVGTSFETANAALMDHARDIVSDQHVDPVNYIDEKSLERWYDGFSYCTWNGLGQSLSEKKIDSALECLAQNNIDISTLIIDDNWQSLDFKGNSNFDFGWTDFEANKENFPGGLKQTITRLRRKYSNIKHVAVWHGIFGYWGGISPHGNVANKYKAQEVRKQDQESYLSCGNFTTIAATDVQQLYDDFYGFLVSCGIDSVKADVQFLPDYLADAQDRRDMIYAYQDAWVMASQKHFQARAISCMSQTPQILFHSLLPRDKPRYMARNSDDFFPNAPSSHTWHIFCNAHNALLTQHLNILPDWDMFQTAHEFAGMHAAARCLSGGPIYLTDVPGQHDLPLINNMTAKATDGRAIILRPEKPGITMEQYVKPQSSRFLRIGTTHQTASLLGVFNIGDRSRDELVTLRAFRDAAAGDQKYVVRAHSTGHISGPLSADDALPAVRVQLGPARYEVLTACPVWTHHDTDIAIAVLGLLGKFSGAAAVRSVDFGTDSHSGRAAVVLAVHMKAVGTLGLYLSAARQRVRGEKVEASLQIGEQISPVDVALGAEDDTLELDTETAWRGMRESLESEAAAAAAGGDALVRVRIGID
ncbi:hypothetical protein MBLNU459_g3387t1 [Dothideomycetes sp. NU459]